MVGWPIIMKPPPALHPLVNQHSYGTSPCSKRQINYQWPFSVTATYDQGVFLPMIFPEIFQWFSNGIPLNKIFPMFFKWYSHHIPRDLPWNHHDTTIKTLASTTPTGQPRALRRHAAGGFCLASEQGGQWLFAKGGDGWFDKTWWFHPSKWWSSFVHHLKHVDFIIILVSQVLF